MTDLRRAAAIGEIARGPSYIWKACTLAVVRIVERLLLAAALLAATGDLARGIELAAVLGALYLLRGLLAARLRIETHVRAELLATAAALDADPLRPLATEGEDAFAALVEGADQAVRLAVDLLPDAAGDAVAAALLAFLLLARGTATEIAAFATSVVVAAILAMVVRRDTARRAKRAWLAHLPVWRQVRAILGGRYELVACGRGDDAHRELSVRLDTWRAAEDRYRLVAAFAGSVPVLAAWSAIAMAMAFRLHGGLDLALLDRAALLAGVAPPVVGLLWALHEITKAERGFAPLRELLQVAAERRSATAGAATLDLPNVQTGICVRATGLSFTYPGAAHAALSPTTFTWRAGRLLVVCGPNGSGKTTLLRLLLKLATPSAGQLRVDDASLATIADRSWRGSIAYVAQVPYVDEDATVRDFVRLLAPDATDAALHDALLRVELFERLAHDHPRDPLATRMRTLSAGQTQRVVLARAFVQKAKIVVFDEPDASLDAAGVTLLVSLLRSLAEERLVAVVAHSPMILAAADDVVTLAIADAPSSL